MAEHEQTVVSEFLEILKRNPSVFSSVLQTAQASTNGQTGVLKSPRSSTSASSSDEFEDPGQNIGATPAVESDPSAEDLLARRGRKGKGSKAQQTFRVGQIIVTNNLIFQPNMIMSQLLKKVNNFWLTFQIEKFGFRA